MVINNNKLSYIDFCNNLHPFSYLFFAIYFFLMVSLSKKIMPYVNRQSENYVESKIQYGKITSVILLSTKYHKEKSISKVVNDLAFQFSIIFALLTAFGTPHNIITTILFR